jgi:hypothetical protein
MIVYDFNVVRGIRMPAKTNAPLIIDSNAVLTRPVSLQGFEAIARRLPQGVQIHRSSQHRKFPLRRTDQIRGKALRRLAAPDGFAGFAFKGPDHGGREF